MLLSATLIVSNLIGALLAYGIASYLIPGQIEDESSVRSADLIAIAIYLPIALVIGAVVGQRRAAPVRDFLRDERDPTPAERRDVLMAPLHQSQLNGLLWGVAVVLFAVLNSFFSLEAAASVALTIAFGGISTCAITYLLTERLLRPTAARALAGGPAPGAGVPGVAARSIIFWALGTGVPLLGLMLVALGVLTEEGKVSVTDLAITTIVLSGVALGVGGLAGALASRATADPVISVRDALGRVERGDLDAEVPVYDGSELGRLQAGFNRMVAGLRERERIRETFGAYVDPDIAERILSEGPDAEGEEVEVTLMFCDVRDFTGFAERSTPRQVVATLNRLFERAVPIVRAHGGHVDKFIGDGFLAVFGAPTPAPDHADRALRCALELAAALSDSADGAGAAGPLGAPDVAGAAGSLGAPDAPESPGIEIGIGLNSGRAVAGSIGGAGRLEFSVIGDAVNVAARVEAATRETGDTVLLSEATKRMLRDPHELTPRPGLELKGKPGTTTLHTPS